MNGPRRRSRRNRYSRLRSVVAFLAVIVGLGFLLYVLDDLYRRPDPLTSAVSPLPVAAASPEYILHLNGAIAPSSAGVLMAVADGLFQQAGLGVQLRPGANDADATSSVASNDHAIGLASTQGFLKARAEGLPIVAFAASYALSPLQFFALGDTTLVGPADLEGKRIGYRPGPDTSSILYAFIAVNSISQSRLTLVPSDTAAADLLDRKIDVLLGDIGSDGQTLESSKVPYRSLSPDSFGVHAMGSVYFANERAFSSPSDLERIFVAINNGWKAAYSDYLRTLPIIARFIDDRPDLNQLSRFMDAQRRFLRPSGARFGELDTQRLKNLQDQLLQRRVIMEPLDLTRAVNDVILRDVYRTKAADFF